MIIKDAIVSLNPQFLMEGEGCVKSTKTFAQVLGLYLDKSDWERKKEEVSYEVYIYPEESNNSKEAGALQCGLSVLTPTLIGNECNMTKGHFHANLSCEELYYGLSGEGLLLYLDENGQSYAEKVYAGSIHMIAGNLGHRLVNTGNADLKVFAVWSPLAGYNYERVEEMEFGYRIFKENGEIIIKERE